MSDDDLSGLPPELPAESNSLEDHEAAYGPNGTGEAPQTAEPETPAAAAETPAEASARVDRDEQGRFQKTRHRAKSQQAGPDDVPRIKELTAKLRAAEARAEHAERNRPPEPRYQPPQPPQQVPPGPPQVPPVPPAQPAQTWTPPATRPKPSEDEIGDKYKTYAEFTEDLSDWVGEQREAKRDARQAQERREQTERDWITNYTTQLAEAKARYPDYDTQVQAADAMTTAHQIIIPQVLKDAIVSSSRGAEVTYYLATHHDEYRELIRDTWAVNSPNSIAMVRKVLESRLPPVASPQRSGSDAAVDTGSARRSPSIAPAPRPPNPVRTGPQKIGDDAPDDDSSLEAHEKFHYRR